MRTLLVVALICAFGLPAKGEEKLKGAELKKARAEFAAQENAQKANVRAQKKALKSQKKAARKLRKSGKVKAPRIQTRTR